MSLIDSDENKEKILKKFFEISAIEGCSNEILQRSVIESGFESRLKDILFDNGLLDLFIFANDILNKDVIKEIKMIDISNLGVSTKIRKLMEIRLGLISKNYDSFRQIIFYLKNNPKTITFSVKTSYEFSDLVWYEIGDKSTDYNFYTKRILLSKIYLRTLLYFSKNNSIDKSLLYFDSQIKNIMKFAKVKSNISNILKDLSNNNCDNNFTSSGYFLKKQLLKLPFIRLYNDR
tara:strand:- start:18588 stop:19286 length:699 start_codon:yes stop_codon:yes gene_type:complete